MSSKRPYIVTKGTEVTLVNATSKAQAIRFIAEQTMTAKPASGSDVAFLMGRGWKLHEAVPSQEELNMEKETENA